MTKIKNISLIIVSSLLIVMSFGMFVEKVGAFDENSIRYVGPPLDGSPPFTYGKTGVWSSATTALTQPDSPGGPTYSAGNGYYITDGLLQFKYKDCPAKCVIVINHWPSNTGYPSAVTFKSFEIDNEAHTVNPVIYNATNQTVQTSLVNTFKPDYHEYNAGQDEGFFYIKNLTSSSNSNNEYKYYLYVMDARPSAATDYSGGPNRIAFGNNTGWVNSSSELDTITTRWAPMIVYKANSPPNNYTFKCKTDPTANNYDLTADFPAECTYDPVAPTIVYTGDKSINSLHTVTFNTVPYPISYTNDNPLSYEVTNCIPGLCAFMMKELTDPVTLSSPLSVAFVPSGSTISAASTSLSGKKLRATAENISDSTYFANSEFIEYTDKPYVVRAITTEGDGPWGAGDPDIHVAIEFSKEVTVGTAYDGVIKIEFGDQTSPATVFTPPLICSIPAGSPSYGGTCLFPVPQNIIVNDLYIKSIKGWSLLTNNYTTMKDSVGNDLITVPAGYEIYRYGGCVNPVFEESLHDNFVRRSNEKYSFWERMKSMFVTYAEDAPPTILGSNCPTHIGFTDNTNPTVTITSTIGPSGSTTSLSTVPVTLTLSEQVTGFDQGDITVTNGSISGITGGPLVYTGDVTPTAAILSSGGTVTLDIAGTGFQDLNGNDSTDAQFTITYLSSVPPNELTNIIIVGKSTGSNKIKVRWEQPTDILDIQAFTLYECDPSVPGTTCAATAYEVINNVGVIQSGWTVADTWIGFENTMTIPPTNITVSAPGFTNTPTGTITYSGIPFNYREKEFNVTNKNAKFKLTAAKAGGNENTGANNAILLGDVNQNGNLTGADASKIIQCIGTGTCSTALDIKLADANSNTNITGADASQIIKCIGNPSLCYYNY